jgi:hypothetical protein
MPFSQKSLDFIRNLDIKADIELLQQHLFFRPQCLRNMRISATLLKFGALAGLTLAQIGSILCRPDDDDSKPSQLETLVHKTSVMAAKSRQGEICCPSEKKPLDDWEVSSKRNSTSNPLTQILMTAIGDGGDLDDLRRISRINTEDIGLPSEFKFELGRQNSNDLQTSDYAPPESPWDEDFFTLFEVMLRELIAQ